MSNLLKGRIFWELGVHVFFMRLPLYLRSLVCRLVVPEWYRWLRMVPILNWGMTLEEVWRKSLGVSKGHRSELALNLLNPCHTLWHWILEILTISNAHLLKVIIWFFGRIYLFVIVFLTGLVLISLLKLRKHVFLTNMMTSLLFLPLRDRLWLQAFSRLVDELYYSIQAIDVGHFARDRSWYFLYWNWFICCLLSITLSYGLSR